MRLADNTKLTLAGKKTDTSRLVTNELAPGKQVIYYTVGKNFRYYTEIELKRGANQIKPNFKEWRLPSLSYRLDRDELENSIYTKNKNFSYLELKGVELKEYSAELSIKVKRNSANEQILRLCCSLVWVLKIHIIMPLLSMFDLNAQRYLP